MTKKEMFALIIEANKENKEIVDFCNHEIELLSKKSSGSRKPSAKQIENLDLKEEIYARLSLADKPLSIAEIMDCDSLRELSNQRVSALITLLKKDGKVTRCEGKKATFVVADSSLEE